MPNSGARQVCGTKLRSGIEFDALSTNARCCDQRLFQWLPEILQADPFSELQHGPIRNAHVSADVGYVMVHSLAIESASGPCPVERRMPQIKDFCKYLDEIAPLRLAEEWDNVGLLVGDPQSPAERVMTCLTVTPSTVGEAIERDCHLIVTHHPLPFRPLKRLTTDETPSRLLWELVRAGVSVYSPHTGFDSAASGINQSLGERLCLENLEPLIPIEDDPEKLGAGRVGALPIPQTLKEFAAYIKNQFGLPGIQVVGDLSSTVAKVGLACGSGASFLGNAIQAGCDTLVTGEARFHDCLEADANQVSLVLMGHFASERFAVELLGERIQAAFPGCTVWNSQQEQDPVTWC